MRGGSAARALLLLGLGAATASSACVGDSTSLVQRGLEVARPRGHGELSESLAADQNQFIMEVESKVGQGIRRAILGERHSLAEMQNEENTAMQIKNTIHRLLMKLNVGVPVAVERMASILAGEAVSYARAFLGSRSQEVLDGIASLELDKRNLLDADTVGEALGEIAAIFEGAQFDVVSGVLLELKETVPPSMRVVPKIPSFAEELVNDVKQKLPPMSRDFLEDIVQLFKDVRDRVEGASEGLLLNTTSLGSQAAYHLTQVALHSIKVATDKHGQTEFANLNRGMKTAYNM